MTADTETLGATAETTAEPSAPERIVQAFHSPRDGQPAEVDYLNATLTLLLDSPFKKLSLNEVARRADRSVSHIYKVFDDTGALIARLVERCWTRIDIELRDAIIGDLRPRVGEPSEAIFHSFRDLTSLTCKSEFADMLLLAISFLRRPEALGVADYVEMRDRYPAIRRALDVVLAAAQVSVDHNDVLRDRGWTPDVLASTMINNAFVFVINGPVLPDANDVAVAVADFRDDVLTKEPPSGGSGKYYGSPDDHDEPAGPVVAAERRRAFAAALGRA